MELIFKVLVTFTAIQRLVELFIAKRNEKYILSIGGRIIKEKNYIFMVILHTLWIISLIYFAYFTDLTFYGPLAIISVFAFLCGQMLRITAITTLGKRWSTRIVILPEAPAIKKGVYNYIRHPNYLGVVLEIAALPLMASLFEVMFVFSITNFVILYFRIRFEEECLMKHNNYKELFNLKRDNA